MGFENERPHESSKREHILKEVKNQNQTCDTSFYPLFIQANISYPPTHVFTERCYPHLTTPPWVNEKKWEKRSRMHAKMN